MVLPPVTLELGLYTLEDPNSAKTQITHALNWNDAIGVCNDVFKQSGVQFTLHESSGPADPVGAGTTKGPNGKRFFPYDTAALVPIFPDLYPPGFFDRHDLPPYPPQVKNDNPNGIEGVKPGPAYDGSEEEGTPHQEKPAKAITMSGSPDVEGKLPWLHGRWMRHEDW
jgi:hypothetical protein